MSIKLELQLTEVNQLLMALVDRPYKEVADLISKIQKVAMEQLQQEKPKNDGVPTETPQN